MDYEPFEKTYAAVSEMEVNSPRSTGARSKLRLDKEPLRTLSCSELESVGGGFNGGLHPNRITINNPAG